MNTPNAMCTTTKLLTKPKRTGSIAVFYIEGKGWPLTCGGFDLRPFMVQQVYQMVYPSIKDLCEQLNLRHFMMLKWVLGGRRRRRRRRLCYVVMHRLILQGVDVIWVCHDAFSWHHERSSHWSAHHVFYLHHLQSNPSLSFTSTISLRPHIGAGTSWGSGLSGGHETVQAPASGQEPYEC